MCCRRENIWNASNFFTICDTTAENTLYGTNPWTDGVDFKKTRPSLTSRPLCKEPEVKIHLRWTHSVSLTGKRVCRQGTTYPYRVFWIGRGYIFLFFSDSAASQNCKECVTVSVKYEKSRTLLNVHKLFTLNVYNGHFTFAQYLTEFNTVLFIL